MGNQAYVFFVFILNGFLIGLLFDVFRILRKSFTTNDFVTYIEDIAFWIISAIIMLYSIFKFNNGELRGFIFVGILVGVCIYLLLFSRLFIKVNVFIIDILKRIIYYVLILPSKTLFKYLRKIIFKPVSFIFINLRKNMSKFKIKTKKTNKKDKKINSKKDLA